MVDKEKLLRYILDDIRIVYEYYYEDDICNTYENFAPCPYFKKGKYGCENHDKCKLYVKDLIDSLYED